MTKRNHVPSNDLTLQYPGTDVSKIRAYLVRVTRTTIEKYQQTCGHTYLSHFRQC